MANEEKLPLHVQRSLESQNDWEDEQNFLKEERKEDIRYFRSLGMNVPFLIILCLLSLTGCKRSALLTPKECLASPMPSSIIEKCAAYSYARACSMEPLTSDQERIFWSRVGCMKLSDLAMRVDDVVVRELADRCRLGQGCK